MAKSNYAFYAELSSDGKMLTIDLCVRLKDFPFSELLSDESTSKVILDVRDFSDDSEFYLSLEHGYGFLYHKLEENEKILLDFKSYPSIDDGKYEVVKPG